MHSFFHSLPVRFAPSLFLSHKLRHIHMGCELWRWSTSETACLPMALSRFWWNNLPHPTLSLLQITSVCKDEFTVGYLICHFLLFYTFLWASPINLCNRTAPSSGLPLQNLSFHPFLPLLPSPRLSPFASIIKHPALRNLRNVAQMLNVSFFI